MRARINSQMLFLPDMTAFFALFFDAPLTSAKDRQPAGINHPLRYLTSDGRFKTDINRLSPLADMGVIQTAQRDRHQGKNNINKALCDPQGRSEDAFNHRDSGAGTNANRGDGLMAAELSAVPVAVASR